MSDCNVDNDNSIVNSTSGSPEPKIDQSKDECQLRGLPTPQLRSKTIAITRLSVHGDAANRTTADRGRVWDIDDLCSKVSITNNENDKEQQTTNPEPSHPLQVAQVPSDDGIPSQPSSLETAKNPSTDPGPESRWLRQIQNGQEMYIDKKTDQTWIPAIDSTGKTYYYEVNSRHSVWVLDDFDTPTDTLHSPETESCDFRSPVGADNCQAPDSEFDDWSDFEDSVLDTTQGPVQFSAPPDSHKPKDGTRLRKSSKLCSTDPHISIHRLKSPAPKQPLGESTLDGLDQRSRLKEHISGPQQNRLTNFERRAAVNRCTLFENGKNVSKKWTPGFLLLSGSWLLLYKDARGATSKSSQPFGKPEIQLNLQEIQISDPEPKYTSRNNVLKIEHGPSDKLNVYLIQVPSNTFEAWKTAIRYARELIEEERVTTVHRSPNSRDGRRHVNLDSSILTKLRDFFRNRPSAAKLRSLGILKNEPVFASTLIQVCEQENSDVPNFVVRVIRAIEARGLDQLGIYRVSGNGAAIQKLRCAVNQNNYSLKSDKWTLEVLTGALKLFFRELKEPLITFRIYPEISRLILNKEMDPGQRMNEVRDLLNSMPGPHVNTARVLLHHLHRVTLYSETNKMEPYVLGIVFGPSLMWPEIESNNFGALAAIQAPFVVYMLQNVVQLFGPIQPPPVVC